MGRSVNAEKMGVQCIGIDGKEVKVIIGQHELKHVDDFVYLGGSISGAASTDQDKK